MGHRREGGPSSVVWGMSGEASHKRAVGAEWKTRERSGSSRGNGEKNSLGTSEDVEITLHAGL